MADRFREPRALGPGPGSRGGLAARTGDPGPASARVGASVGTGTAVDGLSFVVEPGVVTGFLRPNGAGKSTAMRMIAGLDRPTSGSVRVNGKHYPRPT